MTADLAAWLLANDGPIATIERAQDDFATASHEGTCGYNMGYMGDECFCEGPARVLAECAAKRQIAQLYLDTLAGSAPGMAVLEEVVDAIGQVFAGRPRLARRMADHVSEPGPRTLAEAIKYRSYPPHPCACRGGPTCCILNSARAHNLHRAAHIVARQLADLATHKAKRITKVSTGGRLVRHDTDPDLDTWEPWTQAEAEHRYLGQTLTAFEWPEGEVLPGTRAARTLRGPIVAVEVAEDGWSVTLTANVKPIPPTPDTPGQVT